ncbi:hypothetical protein CR513_40249, partial [Mucuna pruriens]
MAVHDSSVWHPIGCGGASSESEAEAIRGDRPIHLLRDEVELILAESKSASSPKVTRANILYDLDHEIELTLRRIRKVRNTVVSTNSILNTSLTFKNSVSTTNNTDFSNLSAANSFSSLNNSQQQELMENWD